MATRIRDKHAAWMKKPGYRKAYAALGREFDLAGAVITCETTLG